MHVLTAYSRLDGQQSSEAERRQDTDHLVGYASATRQGHGASAEIAECHGSVFNCC